MLFSERGLDVAEGVAGACSGRGGGAVLGEDFGVGKPFSCWDALLVGYYCFEVVDYVRVL